MLTKIIIVLAVLVAGFLVVVALQPSTFRVERSLAINAPPAALFAQVNDLKSAQAWSPWAKLDPAARYTFEGPPAGVGTSCAWAGNDQIGEGRQTITESRPNEYVRTRLDFKKPFESTCTADFTLKPEADKTVVTWSMYGESGFVAKAFCLFVSQDKMIGGPFEEGLARLKALSESPATK